MIFARTIDLVLQYKKRCTTRLCYMGDNMCELPGGKVAVLTFSGRTRWCIGNVYAVQRERCHCSEGRIHIDRIEAVDDPLHVSLEVAQAEGFDSVEAYQEVWRSLHKSKPIQPCWRLWFTLISRKA